MIGNERDAGLALDGILEYLGEGSTRDVYLSDGIVYKVDIEEGTNDIEYRNAMTLKGKTPAPFIVPDVYLYRNGVLAMPYITGDLMGECWNDGECCADGICMPDDIARIGRTIGLDIPTWGNTVKVGSLYYLIDLGSIA